ncbi:MAG TPA: hypothetical protein PKE21_08520 [Flavobacteriales bacterium]|nr:hypothetical protein [Flavobacteriales bacterium]HMR27505.1 hypothetical protein [Flavobacteriales bacterium]
MLKMLVAAGFGVGFGFTFLETFLWTAVGGCLGVLVFYRLSERLTEWSRERWLQGRARAHARGVALRRIFTRRNRWIIRLKHVSGYLGVAALTPLVLTIPLGSILAARFFHHDRRMVPALLVSVVVQALGVSAALTGVVGGITRALP